MNKLFAILFLSLFFFSCSNVREYNSVTVYDSVENSDDCYHTTLDKDGKIAINTSLNFIKINVFGEERKFKIKSYEYFYPPFTFAIFGRKKLRKGIKVYCENGYYFYVLYDRYCILTIPDDGDEDYCDDRIFYSL